MFNVCRAAEVPGHLVMDVGPLGRCVAAGPSTGAIAGVYGLADPWGHGAVLAADVEG